MQLAFSYTNYLLSSQYNKLSILSVKAFIFAKVTTAEWGWETDRHRGNRLKWLSPRKPESLYYPRWTGHSTGYGSVYKTFKTPTTGFTTTCGIETIRKAFHSSTLRNGSYLWRMRHRSSQLVHVQDRAEDSSGNERLYPDLTQDTSWDSGLVVGLVLRWWITSRLLSCSSLCSDQILLYSPVYVMQ